MNIEKLENKKYNKEELKEMYNINIETITKNNEKYKKIYERKQQVDWHSEEKFELDKQLNRITLINKLHKQNIIYVLYKILEQYDYMGNVWNKYINKGVGEKTKEKIEKEIEEYFQENYNIGVNCYFNKLFEYGTMKMSIHIGLKEYSFGYKESLELEIRKYENQDKENIYIETIGEYIEPATIENIIEELDEELKEKERIIENKIKEIQAIRDEYNDQLMEKYDILYDNFRINVSNRLY